MLTVTLVPNKYRLRKKCDNARFAFSLNLVLMIVRTHPETTVQGSGLTTYGVFSHTGQPKWILFSHTGRSLDPAAMICDTTREHRRHRFRSDCELRWADSNRSDGRPPLVNIGPGFQDSPADSPEHPIGARPRHLRKTSTTIELSSTSMRRESC